MTATKNPLHRFRIIFFLLIAIKLADSRYLTNELTNQSVSSIDSDDDFDLETFAEDYYDDLLLRLEKFVLDGEKKRKEEEGEEKAKANPKDYDYMSDMPVGEPETNEKKAKNFTWGSTNTSGFNGTLGYSQLADVMRANRESYLEEELPLRSKKMRLQAIKNQVLSFRGGNSRSNVTTLDAKHYNILGEFIQKNLKPIKYDESTSYTEKVQSFYPSCDIPRNTDEDVWRENEFSMNLFFDVDYPTPQEDSTIIIETASLRLYKLPQENHSVSNMSMSEDLKIQVIVYWYTRSLRRNRVQKKLLSNKMLPLYAASWAEFDIRFAVRTWKESKTNFGLAVTVEDDDRKLLPVKQFIQPMNCSKWTATIKPIPSVIMDRANQYFIENISKKKNETANEEEKHKIYPYQPLFYPIMDVRTKEVPNSEVEYLKLVNSAKKTLETQFLNLSSKGLKLDSSDLRDLSKVNKSINRKSERKEGESRGSFFQNVPIGSPSPNRNRKGLKPESHSHGEESSTKSKNENFESEGGNREEREMPRIRHNRRQWDGNQKSTNSRSTNDFNATDHD